jgi:uncharacterized membrane protein YfcA
MCGCLRWAFFVHFPRISEPRPLTLNPVEIPILALSIAVLAIAFAYSSVGLGGGSSYTALLTIVGFTYTLIPSFSLALNTVVTLGATFQFARRGHLKMSILAPFILTSIPAAFVGGSLALSEDVFRILLMVSLLAVAGRIYLWKDPAFKLPQTRAFRLGLSLVLGLILGFVAGTVGIGGGIYLVPIIILTGIGSAKEAGAAGAAFILINSVVGLAARARVVDLPMDQFLPLAAAVLVGGLLGSHYGSGQWKPRTLQKVLGNIILVAIVLLARKIFF